MNRFCAEQEFVTCRTVGVYANALTRGKVYPVLERSPDREKLRLCGDNGRSRWFPTFNFESGETILPCLSTFEIEDSPGDPVEVSVTLTTGEIRCCVFATPDALAQGGDILDGTQVRYHHGPHLIVATELNRQIIGEILKEIDSQDELLVCTLPAE